MSDEIKHECGIAYLRLLKPTSYYIEKYGTPFWGLNKMQLMMEKQHNRGQDGVGLACLKLNSAPGKKYVNIEKSIAQSPIQDVFKKINTNIAHEYQDNKNNFNDENWLRDNIDFCGDIYLGHLRYGTFGRNNINACHPFSRKSNWKTRNLLIAGNFNLTNVKHLFNQLVEIGQQPTEYADTVTMLESLAHFLDEENNAFVTKLKAEKMERKEISQYISENLDINKILTKACKNWDGGYIVSGMIGHGDSFIIRDPAGIRPAFYYADDEIIVCASERPAMQTAFNLETNQLKELGPAQALVVRKDGSIEIDYYKEPLEKKPCSFERIYFSRGTDADIYQERKELGWLLTPSVLKAIDYDIRHTVFSFIPNTAENCYYGLVKGLQAFCREEQKKRLLETDNLDADKIDEILQYTPRTEKLAVKDVKMRTFISDDSMRNDLATYVYDISYNTVNKGEDNIVVVDDSIVRGTTMRQSILRILDRLGPKKIIVLSSAPQIRYPDCYGIDMANLEDFCAFRAAIELIKDTNQEQLIQDTYQAALEQLKLPDSEMVNVVQNIYKPFTPEQISEKISDILKPDNINAKVEIIYQSIEALHEACPNHKGDWYFTGDYPTPGGTRVVNQAFINFVEGRKERAY